MDKLVKVVSPGEGRVEREEAEDPNAAATERWFWTTYKGYDGKNVERLGCCTHIGTNYAEISFPTESGSSSTRVHLDHFFDFTRREFEPEAYIKGRVAHHQDNVRSLMGEVQRVTAQLGCGQPRYLGDSGEETTALARTTGTGDAKAYSEALTKAKTETLPELFKKIEEEHKQVAIWMKAELLGFQAKMRDIRAVTSVIERRIFGVELYAGLCESVEMIQEGAPAADGEKVHLFQRQAYMDEECLLDYDAGGMDFAKIRDFDKWLLRPHNLARLLPYPRCVVSFKVRRHEKHREAVTIAEYIRLRDASERDKLTFLYIRNGDQVFCLETKIDFTEKLFPDADQRDLLTNGQVYIEHRGTKLLSQASYDQRVAEEKIALDQYQKACKERRAAEKLVQEAKDRRDARLKDAGVFVGPHDYWGQKRLTDQQKSLQEMITSRFQVEIDQLEDAVPKWQHEPYHRTQYDYIPFSPNHIEFDDTCERLQRAMDDHNRIVLVLQGLLDRSPVFHPHPPWQLGTPEGFVNGLELVHDYGRALHAGAKPDFEAFRKRMNLAMKRGAYCTGQMAVWEEQEAEKYNKKNYDTLGRERTRYRPHGNPGPGAVAKVVNVKDGMVTFVWEKPRENFERDYRGRKIADQSPTVEARMTAPIDRLMAVDFYKKGDYKQFFNDPRTREEYLQWAPFLLAAEDFKGQVK